MIPKDGALGPTELEIGTFKRHPQNVSPKVVILLKSVNVLLGHGFGQGNMMDWRVIE